MTDECWANLPPSVVDRFIEACEERDDAPSAALERLLLEYCREDDLDARVAEIHDAIVNEDASDTRVSRVASTTQLLEEYDSEDEEALNQLTNLEADIAIDPADVVDENLPGSRDVKVELIKAVARHEYTVMKKHHLKNIADDLLDVGPGYRQREYIEPIWAELTALDGPGVKVACLADADGALKWMDDQLEKRGVEAETDLYWLATELHHGKWDISEDKLNQRLERVSLDVEQLPLGE
jgi:hypothetical protein